MLLGLGALKAVLPHLRHLESIELLLVKGPPNLIPNVNFVRGLVSDFGENCPSLKHMAMCERLSLLPLNSSMRRYSQMAWFGSDRVITIGHRWPMLELSKY
jgi:hypothetical protein